MPSLNHPMSFKKDRPVVEQASLQDLYAMCGFRNEEKASCYVSVFSYGTSSFVI